MNHSYFDSVSIATHHAFDGDIPCELWGNTIVSEACMLSGMDSDRLGCGWD